MLRTNLFDHIYNAYQWYNIRLEMDAGVGRIYRDSTLVLTTTMPIYAFDTLGFRIHRANGEFDNLLLVDNTTAAVSETFTLALMALGGLLLALRRRVRVR